MNGEPDQVDVMQCGCVVSRYLVRDLSFLDPCSVAHKELAQRLRLSRVVVRSVS